MPKDKKPLHLSFLAMLPRDISKRLTLKGQSSPVHFAISQMYQHLAEIVPVWVVASALAAAAKEPRGCPKPPLVIPLCHGDSESTEEQAHPRKTDLELGLNTGTLLRQAQEITYEVPRKIKCIS